MGIKITSVVETDKGESQEVYVMINEIYMPKSLNAQYAVKVYKSKADRDAGLGNTVKTFILKDRYDFTVKSIDTSVKEAYALIKAEIAAAGVTTVDL